MERQEAIEHLPFFERLGAVDEGSAEWLRTRAGLVTLRLVDACARDQTPFDAWNLRAIRIAIEAVPATDPMRSLLLGVVDTVERSGARARPALMPRLVAIGRALEFDAEWDLATDVYHAVEKHASPAEDGEIAADASMRIGFCARMQGRWDVAMDAYLRAGRLADMLGDRTRVLRSRLAHAIVIRQRGNWPLAARLLDETIADCIASSENAVCAPALHERATLAFQQKEFERGIVWANESLALQDSATERDRVMIDMASAFLELGVRAAARDAYLVVAATAQEQWSRWLATINLMELAYLEGSEPTFEQYRRQLASAHLPPPLRAGYLLVAGRGLQVFGSASEGQALLREAVAVSAAASVNDILFQAEESLNAPPQPSGPRTPATAPAAPITAIANDLRRKREKAGL